MYEGEEWILEESEKHVKFHCADMLAVNPVIVIDIDRCSCLPRGTIVRNARQCSCTTQMYHKYMQAVDQRNTGQAAKGLWSMTEKVLDIH